VSRHDGAPGEGETFPVRVVYVYPSDQPRFPAYERAIAACVAEVRAWYRARAGVTFRVLPLEVVRAPEDYLTLRCGADRADRARGLRDRGHMPRWVEAIARAVGGWRPRTATLVFAQGGGGVACANLQGDFAGWALVGDWVLEPISGCTNPQGITAAMCETPIYVTGGTPTGTVAHELGHAFGLHHPDGYAPDARSIMRAHWDYPDTGFLGHERLVLRHTPFTAPGCFDPDAPFVDYRTEDAVVWGQALEVYGRGFAPGDVLEFLDENGARRVPPGAGSPERLTVTVPEGVGPGLVRVRRGGLRSNAVPINVYERLPAT
jgi:hypothetical protein